MTLFHLDPLSRTPIYEQLKRQIMTYISVGLLKENDQLPSVRQFAQDLGINPNTVHRVYRELEQTGVLYTVPQKGTFVSGIPDATPKNYEKWTQACYDLCQRAVAWDLDLERCQEIFDEQLIKIKAWKRQQGSLAEEADSSQAKLQPKNKASGPQASQKAEKAAPKRTEKREKGEKK